MKDFFRFLTGFLPWIAFALLSGPPLLRLEIAIAVSLLLSLIVGYSRLKKGFILTWGTLIFFSVNMILVAGLKNVWVMKHMGILAPFSLAAITWISLALGKPFVLQFARENVPVERWDDPEFVLSCRNLTLFWGCLFVVSTLVGLAKFLKLGGPEWMYGALSFAVTVFGLAFTEWFKQMKRGS